MEGKVGQHGSAFEEAEGGGWDFPGEDPCGDPPAHTVALLCGQMGCESLVLCLGLRGWLLDTSSDGAKEMEVWR